LVIAKVFGSLGTTNIVRVRVVLTFSEPKLSLSGFKVAMETISALIESEITGRAGSFVLTDMLLLMEPK